MHKRFWWESYWHDLDVGGSKILKCILEKEDGVLWTGFIWLRIGTRAGSYEHSNKLSGSIKYFNILE
jgi:hypothetical protein